MALCAPIVTALLGTLAASAPLPTPALTASLAASPSAPPTVSAAVPAAVPAFRATSDAPLPDEAPAPAEVLLEALAREPRVAGTPSHERGVDALLAALRARGLEPERFPVEVPRAVPTRSDVLLFEDGIAASPFAGLKERWDPAAAPASPLPAAFAWNPAAASVRGPVVDLGAGLDADFEEAARMRIALEGTVALVTVPAAPASRRTTVRGIALRAAARGCVGVLIAPLRPGPRRNDFVLADTATASAARLNTAAANIDAADTAAADSAAGESAAADPAGPEAARLPLPCAPVRSAEAAAIRERLRVRRVRGASGRTVTLRVGPGPVEVGLDVRCPLEWVEASALRVSVPSAVGGRRHLVPTDHRVEASLGGAATLSAAVGAVAALRDRPLEHRDLVVFAPRRASSPTLRAGPGLLIDAALAPRAGAPLLVRFGRLGPSRLAPRQDELTGGLVERLAGQLAPRLEASTAWIEYGLAGEDVPRRPSGARAGRALERLLAPLPSER